MPRPAVGTGTLSLAAFLLPQPEGERDQDPPRARLPPSSPLLFAAPSPLASPRKRGLLPKVRLWVLLFLGEVRRVPDQVSIAAAAAASRSGVEFVEVARACRPAEPCRKGSPPSSSSSFSAAGRVLSLRLSVLTGGRSPKRPPPLLCVRGGSTERSTEEVVSIRVWLRSSLWFSRTSVRSKGLSYGSHSSCVGVHSPVILEIAVVVEEAHGRLVGGGDNRRYSATHGKRISLDKKWFPYDPLGAKAHLDVPTPASNTTFLSFGYLSSLV